MLNRFGTSCLLAILLAGALPAQNADIRWLRDINHPYHPHLDNAMRFTSNSVTPVLVIVPVGIAAYDLLSHRPDSAFCRPAVIAAAILADGAISTGLKYAVNRPRPYVTYPDIVKRSSAGLQSFPSSHTSFAFALATSASLEFPRWYVIAPSYAWACTVAYSRMRLGMHYPSDVAAGALTGAGCAWLSWWVNKKLMKG